MSNDFGLSAGLKFPSLLSSAYPLISIGIKVK